MKFILRTAAVLLAVNGILLYMHFSQKAGGNGQAGAKELYSQEIEVVSRKDTLLIRHHFKGLTSGRHEIVFPSSSRSQACYIETESSCDRLNEAATAIMEGETQEQSVSYEIPKSISGGTSLYVKPFAALRGAAPAATILHITDETGEEGTWLSGLERIGEKKMKRIDYSLFVGSGQADVLYWQNSSLPLVHGTGQLSVYGQSLDQKTIEDIEEAMKKSGLPHAAVIIDNKRQPFDRNRLFMADSGAGQGLSDRILIGGVKSKYKIPPDEKITSGIVASIVSGRPAGTERSQTAYKELANHLTDMQLEELSRKLSGAEALDAKVVDRMIGDLSGMNTSFVENSKDDAYSFYLEDPRPVSINGKQVEALEVVVQNGKSYYPARKLLSPLGMDVSSTEQSLYVKGNANTYRFSLRDPFYVWNDRKHTYRDQPYELINGSYHFEESAVRRIFKLQINKTEEMIDISSTQTAEEGGSPK